mgnify:CR=1 FL=1
MPANFDSIPFEEWDIKLDSESLDDIINDDSSFNIDQLTDQERVATDTIVIGREHGQRSASALAKIAAAYKPDLIIHEYSFSSEHQKQYATITANGLMFDVRSVVGALSRNIPIGERAIYTDEYLSSIPDRDNNDIFLLTSAIRESKQRKRPVIRIIGETDAGLASMTGAELDRAYSEVDDKQTLVDTEAQKIIAREDIMVKDVSTIIANTRRKLTLDQIPQLNVMVVCGLFHARFLHKSISTLGISPAGVAGRIALDDKVYDLRASDVYFLPADEVLGKKVEELRQI